MQKVKYVDLSHDIEQGMITYKGIPAPVIRDHMTREDSRKNYEPGTEFYIGMIEMASNTGTYIDSPFHRYSDGVDLSELPLNCLAGIRGVRVSYDGVKAKQADISLFDGLDLKRKAVLVQTGWDRFWRTEAYQVNPPYLTQSVAEFLRDKGALLVGIDSYNIDNINGKTRQVHSILLKAGIPIVEHMCNLKLLPDNGFTFFAVPPKIKSFGSFPVRAFAMI